MMIGVYLFIGFVIIQRIVEMKIANRNAKWIRSQGGYEAGIEHYKLIVLTHSLFFLSLLFEVTIKGVDKWHLIPLVVFILAQLGRVWALASLGNYWNTRIMVLPGAKVVAKGPYRYVRHPNYIVVIIEIAVLPLIWQAYWTAVLFTIINALVLSIRIKEEETALQEATNYEEVFDKKKRFMPKYDRQ